jgi:glycogen operon protein
MYDMRRLLKGDEGMLYEVMKHMRINPSTNGVINYITNYYGFTMADLFSYDRKYNEANGEDNKDGVDYNFSWNCGAEGSTRKKQVLALREKQIRNAFILLMLSQGTPFFYMGDEFGNSQKGNNNPYCQDNEITWLNWKDLNKNKEIYSFVKELISLRKNTGVFHLPKECMIMDYKSCGCPDISYHGEEAWKPSWEHYSRQIGFMLCGDYAEGCEGKYYFVAVNMHWEDHEFALPKLPKKKVWKKLMTTSAKEVSVIDANDNINDAVYRIEKRSITMFIGE